MNLSLQTLSPEPWLSIQELHPGLLASGTMMCGTGLITLLEATAKVP